MTLGLVLAVGCDDGRSGSTDGDGTTDGTTRTDMSMSRTDSGTATGGECSPACPSAQQCCGTSCVGVEFNGVGNGTLDSSFDHCGACNAACNPEKADRCARFGGSGPPQCLCGANNLSCGGNSVCVQSDGVTICADLNSDPSNCGAPGNACAEGEACTGGSCGCGASGAPCGAGESCCGGVCIDTQSDGMNCGACGTVCPGNAPDCNAGSCGCGAGPACTAPTAGVFGMGGDPGESCCAGACVANDTTSCGCMACSGDDECQVSGGGFIGGGGEVTVCCGGPEVAITGCGGGGFPGLGDGGVPGLPDAGI
ncbi:MAG: hypothetical protein CMN30_23080 [Sandaracinus sp.]|nr:hypothetical protein [Sandaracinus sp.]